MSEYIYDDVDYGNNPPGVFLHEGGELVFHFGRVDLCPEDHPSVEICNGRTPIVTFSAIRGRGVTSLEGDVDLIPGTEYALWLGSTTLHDGMLEARPEPGEVVAVHYVGKKYKRGESAETGGKPYGLYQVVCPDRPVEESKSLSWDDLKPKSRKR